MNEIEVKQYQEIKQDIKQNILIAAKSFLIIGKRLKEVRDNKWFSIDGYQDIEEFGLEEYGFSRTTTQRYINVVEQFSIGGSSTEILPQFEGCPIYILQELLPLSEEERELFNKKSSREDIREYKGAKAEYEKDVTPLEMEMKKQECAHAHIVDTGCEDNLYKQIVVGFFGKEGKQKERHDLMLEIKKLMQQTLTVSQRTERMVELISPNGNGLYKEKMMFVFMYDYKTGLKYKIMGQMQSPEELNWNDFYTVLEGTFDFTLSDPWTAYYGELESEKESKESEQPKVTKPEPVKTVAKITNKEQTAKQESKVEQLEEEKQIDGQMKINHDGTLEEEKEETFQPLNIVNNKTLKQLFFSKAFQIPSIARRVDILRDQFQAGKDHSLVFHIFYNGEWKDEEYKLEHIADEKTFIRITSKDNGYADFGEDEFIEYFKSEFDIKDTPDQQEEQENTQQEHTQKEVEKKKENSECPPNIGTCIRQEWGTSEQDQIKGRNECKKCWEDYKRKAAVTKEEHSEPQETLEAEVIEDVARINQRKLARIRNAMDELERVWKEDCEEHDKEEVYSVLRSLYAIDKRVSKELTEYSGTDYTFVREY